MKKYEPCSSCDNGWIYSGDSAIKCSCLSAYQENTLIELRLTKAGIEGFDKDFSDYKGRDLPKNLDKIKFYTSGLKSRYANDSHLYLYGPNGTQKSTMSKVILKKAIELGLSGKFILMGDLMDILVSGFQDEEKRATIDPYLNCDLLIIDDCFDKHKIVLYRSGYQLPFLDKFLRMRLETLKKNTIFTSNVLISEIEKNGFSYDIQNLIERTVQFKKGDLEFKDVYTKEETDFDVHSLWS